MEPLKQSVNSFLELENLKKISNIEALYHQVLAHLHSMFYYIRLAEEDGYPKKEIMQVIDPVYRIHSKSPFFKRLQEWPKGYPGDYETIEYIFNSINKAPPYTIEYWIEKYALSSPIAQQHLQKIKYQALEILKVFRGSQSPHVLSLGCGGSRDIFLIKDILKQFDTGQIILTDIDKDALNLSYKRLEELNNQLTLIEGNVIKVIKQFKKTQKFDLIVAGGLFDYLTDKHIRTLLFNIYTMLETGGKFLFTNIAKKNPYRPWIEYMANWVLIERDEEDYKRLVVEAGLPADIMELKREETGLTILIEIIKN